MSIFETQQAIEEQKLQEVRGQGEMMQQYEGNLENMMQEGASDRTDAYQDRIARMEQRNAERGQAAQERASRQNEIGFGSRAAEDATKKLEERAKLERQIKQQEDHLRVHEKELKRAINSDSNYWTQKRTLEIKQDVKNIKNLEKKISEL